MKKLFVVILLLFVILFNISNVILAASETDSNNDIQELEKIYNELNKYIIGANERVEINSDTCPYDLEQMKNLINNFENNKYFMFSNDTDYFSVVFVPEDIVIEKIDYFNLYSDGDLYSSQNYFRYKVDGVFKQSTAISSNDCLRFYYSNNRYRIGTDWLPFRFFENMTFYTSFDIYEFNSDTILYENNLIQNDASISDPNSPLKITYEYNEDYTECKINATLEGGSFTDRIYYSNYQWGVTGELETKKAFPREGITVNENQSLFFQAEDKDGNILAKNSISIFQIGKLSPDAFSITANFSKVSTIAYVNIIPSLKLTLSPYYDIYYKVIVPEDEVLSLVSYTAHMAKEYTLVNNNTTMTYATMDESNFSIYFEIRNKIDGKVVLTKSRDIKLIFDTGIGTGNSGITGGTVNGEIDESINDSNNPFSGLDENSSLEDVLDFSNGSLDTFSTAFSILPSFIWWIIATSLIVIITLRILGR